MMKKMKENTIIFYFSTHLLITANKYFYKNTSNKYVILYCKTKNKQYESRTFSFQQKKNCKE